MAQKEITYTIVKYIGTIGKSDNYSKQINWIAWNNREPVLDIRVWRRDTNDTIIPLKGITLNKEEAIALRELLSCIDLEV